MTLLTLVQQHCQINGLNVPNGVVASADATVIQLLALLNELVEDLTDQSKFQGFTREATHTLTAAEDQGSITTIADGGFLYIYPGTFWDRTRKIEICGPLNEREWQERKAIPMTGTYYCYRFRQNKLLINPAPTAGALSAVAFEYASSYGVVAAAGTFKATFTVDTDTFALPEKILRKGLTWKWKYQKGLNYQLEEQQFWDMLNNAIARDKGLRPVNLNGEGGQTFKPSVTIPYWNTVP